MNSYWRGNWDIHLADPSCQRLFYSFSAPLTLGTDSLFPSTVENDLGTTGSLAIELGLIGPQKVKMPYLDWQVDNMCFVVTMVILLSQS